jgi:hypothetical protein
LQCTFTADGEGWYESNNGVVHSLYKY